MHRGLKFPQNFKKNPLAPAYVCPYDQKVIMATWQTLAHRARGARAKMTARDNSSWQFILAKPSFLLWNERLQISWIQSFCQDDASCQKTQRALTLLKMIRG